MEHPTPEALARLPLFRRIRAEDRLRIAAVARLRTFERGEQVFAEGDEPEAFVTLLSGRVKVYKQTPKGKDVILEIFGPGDPLGAVAVYDGRPYPASAVAIEPTMCVIIPRQPFFGLLEQSPMLVRGLLSGLTLRLVELTNRLTELTGGQVETRFARLFLKLASEIGRAERGGTFISLPLSRQELADLTGTTIETCIRIMSRWGKEGLLTTEKDGFVLLDRPALESLSES